MSVVAEFASQLQFLRPSWLLGLPVLALLAWAWWRRRPRADAWQDAVDAHLLPHVVEGRAIAAGGRAWARWTGLAAAALALLALAGPSLRTHQVPLWQARAPLVVALDLSSATMADDLPPSRLAQARAKLATLLREREGGQLALVVFADDAHTVAPLTDDTANVALFLDALAPAVMPVDGQRADRAIAWSQRLLAQAGFDRGEILLLTDRAEPAAVDAAARAQAAGYRVSVLGLGTAGGGVFERGNGVGQARLDVPALQRLAAAGGGAYRPLQPGAGDLRALGVLHAGAADASGPARGGRLATRSDDGYWLLPLVLLLVMPLFRRSGALAAVLACVLLAPSPPAHARDAGGGWWWRADQAAHARLLEGVAAYRKGDHATAIRRFSGIDTVEGHYNLGNALAKAGRYDEAIAAYDRALARRPGMADAIANRAAVDAARKRKPPPGPREGQREGEDQRPDPRPGQSPGQGEPARQPGQPGADAAPQQAAGDPGRQRQADAAQRQRMQEALRKQQQQGTPAPEPAPSESTEDRERRLANQAQLQRLPDDPGGLLRARFRLEHEQRRSGSGP